MADEDLPQYDSDSDKEEDGAAAKPAQSAAGHISTSAASFRDFLLKPEILRAINDCAFEHPSKGTVPQDATFPCARPHQVRRFHVPVAASPARPGHWAVQFCWPRSRGERQCQYRPQGRPPVGLGQSCCSADPVLQCQ
mmetsp:Transcript_91908/g.148370  ORF Transcript_91908/g.148370 Transcript_91908/m.148370 type:complete len:138 (+) Transcript_91908:2-415(+)